MRLLIGFVLSCCLFGQMPEQDSRNTSIPNTDTHFTAPRYKTLAEWEARKSSLRRQILFAAGLLPMPRKTLLNPKVFGRLEHKDYSIEKVYLETLPGFYLAGNLYRPVGRSGKYPAVAKPHGHWTYGRLENQPLNSTPTLGVNLARQGYVVFAYDMVGYTDTVQTPHKFGSPAEQLWSFGPLGLQLWNSIRVVDFLKSLPYVDEDRIAVTGASGGGTQTFLLAAVDGRIQYSAPVNMVSAIMQGGCRCENAPGLRVGASNIELAAMMAPRPQLLVCTTQDWTKNVPEEEFPAIQRIYALYGAGDSVEAVQFDSPHNYHQASREAVYRFFSNHVLGQTSVEKLSEDKASQEKLQDMLVFHGRSLPANALSHDGLFRQWKEAAARQTERTTDPALLRQRLKLALKTEWPKKIDSKLDGRRILLSRPGVGDRVPGLWIPGDGEPALVVHPAGAEVAQDSPEARKVIASGRPLLLIDAFQTGTAEAPRDRSHEHFLTFNLTDDANRVQDILTALAFLDDRHNGPIELTGLGKAAVWSLFAAAVAPIEVNLSGGLSGFRGADEEFVDQFFVPGIQRAGGLEAAQRLIEEGK